MVKCSKCGTEAKEGDSFCRVCGKKIDEELISQDSNMSIDYTQYEQNNVQTSVVDSQNNLQSFINEPNYNFEKKDDYVSDDELIDAFIGENVLKLKKGGFSWASFFFGIFYAFYRRMYALGFIMYMIIFILNLFIPSIAKYFIFVLNIFLCIFFKSLYLNHARDWVTKIRRDYPNCTNNQLKKICSSKGGTNAPVVLLIVALYILIIYMSTLNIENFINQIRNNTTITEKEVDSTKFNNLTYLMPVEFQEKEYTNNLSIYVSKINDEEVCVIKIQMNAAKDYENDDEAYIKTLIDKAYENKTGARGLKSILENNMLDVMFTLPDEKNVKKINVGVKNDKLNIVKKEN